MALSSDKRRRYGGLARLAGGVDGGDRLYAAARRYLGGGEDRRDAAPARAACGPGWTPQNRSERGVTWGEAARLLWPQTVLGILAFAGFAAAGWTATLWALPLAGGLLAAIPLCVLTADPRVGLWMRDRLIAAIPEELRENGAIAAASPGAARRPLPQVGEVF